MKWTYFPRTRGIAAMWQLDDDDETEPVQGETGKLFVIDYAAAGWAPTKEAESAWTIERRKGPILGYLPFDTPEEELKALAIAMWRLG